MDTTAIASSSQNNISDAGVSQTVAIDVLKKAINIDKANAATLLQSVAQTPDVPNLPAHLGNNVNTTA
ncbi:hypothetical protein AAKU67_001654 [Oxalobacteraceae bacterium GrIS 2.11]